MPARGRYSSPHPASRVAISARPVERLAGPPSSASAAAWRVRRSAVPAHKGGLSTGGAPAPKQPLTIIGRVSVTNVRTVHPPSRFRLGATARKLRRVPLFPPDPRVASAEKQRHAGEDRQRSDDPAPDHAPGEPSRDHAHGHRPMFRPVRASSTRAAFTCPKKCHSSSPAPSTSSTGQKAMMRPCAVSSAPRAPSMAWAASST